MMLLWLGVAFLSGSLPFSVWVGRLALQTDIRRFGDGNPGAANVLRAGGRRWAALALLLETFKGAIPVGLAQGWGQLEGWPLAAIALAPVLGHAFSPFLKFRGGKAVAVTFGVWAGLTMWVVPPVLGLALAAWYALVPVDGWAVVLAMISLLAFLWFTQAGPVLLAVWAGNAAILAWKHRGDLRRLPGLRSWPRDTVRK